MRDILAQLAVDHRNVTTMMDVLERHLRAVHDAESADFSLMHDVMIYMTTFPDKVHHPMEDFMFRRVRERCASNQDLIDKVTREHESLFEKGARFRDRLEHVVDGAMVRRDELEELGNDYVAFMRHHMALEDNEAFPLAARVLEPQDWAWVTEQLDASEDPVFGRVVEEQFKSLLAYIAEHTDSES